MIPADCELTARPAGDPQRGTTWPTSSSPSSPPDGGLRGGSSSTPTTTSGGSSTPRGLEVLDDTLVYYIIGDNGASAEGAINGTFNETFDSTVRRSSRPPSSWRRRSTSSEGPRRTTTTRWVGRTRWTRRTSGPSRSPRTGVARATARSCTGRTGIDGEGEIRAQFHHVIDIAPTVLEAADCPSRRSCTASSRCHIDGVSMAYSFDDPTGRERRETQYFEMFGNRGIYHKGWTAVTRHSTPWMRSPPAARFRRRRLGAVRRRRLDPGPRPRRARTRRSSPSLQRLWLIEASSTTCCRSTTAGRTLQRRPRGSAELVKGDSQLLFGGMGRSARTRCQHQEQVAR